MNRFHLLSTIILLLPAQISAASSPREANLGPNAALLYWAAFSEMQDSAISDAKQMNAILDGTAPYDDSQYRDLVEKNRFALDIMAHGARRPFCTWGLGYGFAEELGPKTPVEYVRKALVLGRLNVLYAYHLAEIGDKERSVRALATGLRFSQDVANGGTLFATVVAKSLLVAHLRAIAFVLHTKEIPDSQRGALQKALAELGPDPLDWQSAMKREMEVLNRPPWQASVSLDLVTKAYVAALKDPSTLPKLENLIAGTPQPLRDVIPNPKQVLEEKQDLTGKLQELRSKLQ
jgi:hypothetical protein